MLPISTIINLAVWNFVEMCKVNLIKLINIPIIWEISDQKTLNKLYPSQLSSNCESIVICLNALLRTIQTQIFGELYNRIYYCGFRTENCIKYPCQMWNLPKMLIKIVGIVKFWLNGETLLLTQQPLLHQKNWKREWIGYLVKTNEQPQFSKKKIPNNE